MRVARKAGGKGDFGDHSGRFIRYQQARRNRWRNRYCRGVRPVARAKWVIRLLTDMPASAASSSTVSGVSIRASIKGNSAPIRWAVRAGMSAADAPSTATASSASRGSAAVASSSASARTSVAIAGSSWLAIGRPDAPIGNRSGSMATRT